MANMLREAHVIQTIQGFTDCPECKAHFEHGGDDTKGCLGYQNWTPRIEKAHRIMFQPKKDNQEKG